MTPDEIATRATESGADISGVLAYSADDVNTMGMFSLMDAVANAAEALQAFPSGESHAYFKAAESLTSIPVVRQAEVDELTAQRDKAIRDRDDAYAERDNLVNLASEVGRLADYLKHAIADRDDFRDMYLEYRDKFEGAQCRMDEMAAHIQAADSAIARLMSERDDAVAKASR